MDAAEDELSNLVSITELTGKNGETYKTVSYIPLKIILEYLCDCDNSKFIKRKLLNSIGDLSFYGIYFPANSSYRLVSDQYLNVCEGLVNYNLPYTTIRDKQTDQFLLNLKSNDKAITLAYLLGYVLFNESSKKTCSSVTIGSFELLSSDPSMPRLLLKSLCVYLSAWQCKIIFFDEIPSNNPLIPVLKDLGFVPAFVPNNYNKCYFEIDLIALCEKLFQESTANKLAISTELLFCTLADELQKKRLNEACQKALEFKENSDVKERTESEHETEYPRQIEKMCIYIYDNIRTAGQMSSKILDKIADYACETYSF